MSAHSTNHAVQRTASQTAYQTACLRAAHQLWDGAPLLLHDPAVLTLLPEARQMLAAAEAQYQAPAAKGLRSHVVLRSRFTEDRLAAAVARGVSQYVVLGAGFDTFAWRQPEWAQALHIVEIDQPATQAEKRTRLAAAGLDLPANVRLGGVDFEHQSLREGLREHGVAFDQPTFFSWLGVTMYLEEAAIDAVLATVAAFPPGSEIVLTFLQPPDTASADIAARQAELARRVAGVGEPFVSCFSPEALERKLRGHGFSAVDFLTPEDAEAHYFALRPRDLPVPSRTTIVAASR